MAFRPRRKASPARLSLWDADGRVLFEGRVTALRFEEARVLDLSMEFYSDPAPCEIHRSAVLQRAMMEIEQALAGGRKLPAEALPGRVRGFFGCYPQLAQIQLIDKEAP